MILSMKVFAIILALSLLLIKEAVVNSPAMLLLFSKNNTPLIIWPQEVVEPLCYVALHAA
jgi:hypothetical protein